MAAKLDCLAEEVGTEDLYEFLGISYDSTDKEITSGYRKKALKCHPDKNPDDPNAADLFQKLSKAYHILTDPAAKSAYDKWYSAKQAAKKRHEELNSKRRKLKESLEMKEATAGTTSMTERDALRQMQKEIERLREDGFHRAREQEEQLRQEFLRRNTDQPAGDEQPSSILKVSWKSTQSDISNGGYSKEILESIFSKFGPLGVAMSRKKGKALVEYSNFQDAIAAQTNAKGNASNPLVIEWQNAPPSLQHAQSETMMSPAQEADYEAITLLRLQNAEKNRKRAFINPLNAVP